MSSEEIRCERCGAVLDPQRAIWLEGDVDGTFSDVAGEIHPRDSIGGFSFGPDCARAVLAESERIRHGREA